MNGSFLLIIVLLIFFLGCFLWLSQLKFIGDTSAYHIDLTKPRILLVNITSDFGGTAMHVVSLYKMLRAYGYHVTLLVPHNSVFSKRLQSLQVSHYTTRALLVEWLRPLYHFILKKCLDRICLQEQVSIIHCNHRLEVSDALAIKRKRDIKVVLTRHVPDQFDVTCLAGIDAIIGVSQFITFYIKGECYTKDIPLKHIEYIPPLFDDTAFLRYTSKQDRVTYFKNRFGVLLRSYPVLVMVGNFYKNLAHKNHPLLFRALHVLIYKKNKPVQVMLAGEGPQKDYLERLVKEFGLEKYVHFLGFVSDVPGLLYHSDALVLSSSAEAFGIVYLEAGLMKKPALGAYTTGAEEIIVHGTTGLLFNNNDAENLAVQIERLIDDLPFAQKLGLQAYDHIIKNFSPKKSFVRYETLYRILQDNKNF